MITAKGTTTTILTASVIKAMMQILTYRKLKEYTGYVSRCFNICDTLQSKDTENKCDVLLELNNIVPGWKKGTSLIASDSILFGLKESKMSQKRLIKVKSFPGATI